MPAAEVCTGFRTSTPIWMKSSISSTTEPQECRNTLALLPAWAAA